MTPTTVNREPLDHKRSSDRRGRGAEQAAGSAIAQHGNRTVRTASAPIVGPGEAFAGDRSRPSV